MLNGPIVPKRDRVICPFKATLILWIVGLPTDKIYQFMTLVSVETLDMAHKYRFK